MTSYKIMLKNKTYTEYILYDIDGIEASINVDIKLNIIDYKIFHEDTIKIDHKNIEIVYSNVRNSKYISGVLILNGTTYGKNKTKFLYKCIPDNKYLPAFLIPYKIPLNYSKDIINIYIIFKYNHWNNKHPHGTLLNNLGSVNVLSNYYEYQLYCKSINASIQNFTRITSKKLKENTEKEFIDTILNAHKSIRDYRNNKNIISIDPKESSDYDDAFELCRGKDHHVIKIYISNVTIWIETLNLWESFSNRVSTIYLPDRKRPMLPTSLSECLCSLQENVSRFAFVCEFKVKDYIVTDTSYYNAVIKVSKNYSYEEDALLKNPMYLETLNLTRRMSRIDKLLNNVKDSHNLVSYLMILMNYHTATSMALHKIGIYRTVTIKRLNEDTVPPTVSHDVSNFIKIYNSSSGEYIEYNEINLTHDFLKLKQYLHITSPIRRLVDLLNIIIIQNKFGLLDLSKGANTFKEIWINKLTYINDTMKSIRKVQNECALLDVFQDNKLLEQKYKGFLFNKMLRNDGQFQYTVYLHDVKLISKITSKIELNNYDEFEFTIYYFKNESNFKHKIRVQFS